MEIFRRVKGRIQRRRRMVRHCRKNRIDKNDSTRSSRRCRLFIFLHFARVRGSHGGQADPCPLQSHAHRMDAMQIAVTRIAVMQIAAVRLQALPARR